MHTSPNNMLWGRFAHPIPMGGFKPSMGVFRSFSTSRAVAVPYGWVYAFYSPSMPGLVKLGMTTRSPEIRLAEANKGDTWRPPEKYRILCALRVKDAAGKEKEIHAAFARQRLGAREFFRLNHPTVLQYFKRQSRAESK